MTLELTLLTWSVVILFVHIGLQSGLLTRDLGSDYNAGPRDEKRELGVMAGRADRALRNFAETYPAFIILALVAGIAGISNGLTQWGAGAYILFRLLYIPLYLLGVPYLRSLIFIGACIGLLLMFCGIVF
ncbi:MAPEG family protein [Pelagibacterium luteolum]|uniref:Uncharacterized conserved protein, MAPEG superfamily n=1 Tax=Pelagibacterium luteolum TaxID=440168 RepID=A0A1G7SCJ7_9HYPH|nr:MAPEG family protein [Pelagibacterium luteolum]SDG19910.1 Uncharacterized conserved protein, MAPEG superfamily [Pelagibacterium luteolum]